MEGTTHTKLHNERLSIGEIAAEVGVTPRTVRYYANLGLIANIERVEGRRRFSRRDIYVLRFIQRLKMLGLSLGEIRGLRVDEDMQEALSDQVAIQLDGHLDAIKDRIVQLQLLRKDIQAYKSFVENHR